jgi:hypothetical protein
LNNRQEKKKWEGKKKERKERRKRVQRMEGGKTGIHR